MAAFRFRRRRTRRLWMFGATTSALAAVLLLIVASASGNLAGSTFEGSDGNLVVNTAGNMDWANVAGLSAGVDTPSGTSDNSFGQGTKEDDANVTVVSGSIPPQKSDLTRFYEASESISGQTFLYLAWERTNVLGSANMDFEINQAVTPGLGSPGPHTILRTPGDLLVTYDFTNGGTKPTLGLNTWLTSATTPVVPSFATNVCLSSNKFPCWGDHIDLNATNSEGAINSGTVTDPIPPNNPRSLAALTFGEAAVNLTAAGVFPPGTCEAFGSAFLKSRASASFPAEVKDFVAPIPVNISNCGRVTIIKNTDPRGLNQDFTYTSTIPNPAAGQTPPSPDCTSDTSPSSFTLNDGSASTPNTEDCSNVLAGSYTITEGTEPANFTLKSLTCEATAGSSGSQDGTNPFQANITVIPNGHVTCTYVNLAGGAIKVVKTAKNHNLGAGQHPLAGAMFTVDGVSKMTDANGTACFDGLTIGTSYTVTETSAPPGYSIDTTSQSVTPTSPASCTSGTPDTVTFTDSPLADVFVSAASEVSGVTNSSITCVDSNNADVGNSPQGPADPVTVNATGLKPGTYTCTITIDP